MKVSIAAGLALALATATASAQDHGAPPDGIGGQLDRLLAAYPDTIDRIDGNDLVLFDGRRLAILDGRTDKSFEEMLAAPDIDDMFALPYPRLARPAQPAVNADPGRIRVEPLFRALYGDCRKGEVAPRMRAVAWVPKHGGGTVRFTTAQGAADALEAVSRQLERLPARFAKFLRPTAGTYNCRAIAGTGRMSMHAYGAAIDLNVEHSAYWRWQRPGPDGTYRWRNAIPKEIVDVFERHGFVWGGRWYHFDTMHFEFRPELAGSRPRKTKKAGD